MKKILLLATEIILTLTLNAQVNIKQVNLSDIYLEFSGESVSLFGVNAPIVGQLFYSKDKGYLTTENSNSFATDKSLIVVKPIIRILKTSENYPQNLSLSIKLYTSEITNGEEKRIYLDTQFDSYIKDQAITKTIKTNSNEQYIIFDDGLSSRALTITFENTGTFAKYSDQGASMSFIRLDIKGLKLTVEKGKRIN